jgi:protein-L-isoaspartate(D-aspartate) O-methyltransferase
VKDTGSIKYQEDIMDFASARRNMVDCQILTNRVDDERVIAVMSDLPRESFVPKPKQGIAYVDEALAIGDDRFIMEPMIIARLLQALNLKSSDVALSIGCGSGYAVAVLAGIVNTVVAVEADAGLVQRASKTLSDLEIDNVVVVEGVLTDGYPKQAPYDVVFFDGAVNDVPDAILNQLADGGRAAVIVEGTDGVGHCRVYVRAGDHISCRDQFDAGTPVLPGFAVETEFSF